MKQKIGQTYNPWCSGWHPSKLLVIVGITFAHLMKVNVYLIDQ